MIDRRHLLKLASASALTAALPDMLSAASAKRVLFVHGRAQQALDPVRLQAAWVDALRRGIGAARRTMPTVEFAFPYYGDTLDRFTRDVAIPLTSEMTTRGGPLQDEFLVFQAEFAEAVRQRSGVTDAQIDAQYGSNPRTRGPLNWEWVQAILRAIDINSGGVAATTLELFTRDVFLYCSRAGVRDQIDQIVASQLTEEPTVVVGHSLGSLVAYSVLRTDRRRLQVPVFVTVGSPLGVRSVRDHFRPLSRPPIDQWFNAYDPRDVVALYPLDGDNFPIQPAIQNHGAVNNHTDNRHGIDGYLDDVTVAGWIVNALAV